MNKIQRLYWDWRMNRIRWGNCPLRKICANGDGKEFPNESKCEVIVNESFFERFKRYWLNQMNECYRKKK
jgi:hypothetical protein